ncbi:MAG: hypothetical protein MI923_22550, partial [Phycisphaerales bacterium]|nr:hypothetical protein [Phycisphaerales bacterium]
RNCHHSCHVNGQDSIKVVGITWGQFSPNLFRLPVADIILGSDCFYDIKGDYGIKITYLLEYVPTL